VWKGWGKSPVNLDKKKGLRRVVNGNGCFQSEKIRGRSEAGNLTAAHGGDPGLVTEFLPCVDVGKVDLDRGNSARGDGVTQCDAGVGEGGGVEDDGLELVAGLLDPINQNAFVVRLAEIDGDISGCGLGSDPGFDVRQGEVAVDARFAGAEEIQVRTVEEEDLHGVGEVLEAVGAAVDANSSEEAHSHPRKVIAIQPRAGTYSPNSENA